MTRYSKGLLITIIIFILTSCSRNLFISESYQIVIKNILEPFSNKGSIFTRDIIEGIPYASALISFGKQESLIILETKNDKRLTWVSADRKVFFTKNGRVISTVGLPNNLYKIDFPSLGFKNIIEEKKLNYIAYYSFRDPKLDNIKVKVTAEVIGREEVDLLGFKKNLVLIEEVLYSEKINWKSKNKFWIDPVSKYVWKSEQSLSPKLPVIKMTITKKPR